MLSQEFAVAFFEVRNPVEDIAPEVEVITLVDDAVIRSDRQLCATKEWRARVFIELHHHRPLHEHRVAVLHNGMDFHIQLPAAAGQPPAHLNESCFPCDLLDTVLEYDLIMVIRKYVRPIRFSFIVISL